MNNRFAQGTKAMPEEIRKLFDRLSIISGGNIGVNYDIRPTNDALVVVNGDEGYEAHAMRFGLWEPWMDGKRISTFNARSETIEEKRLFAPLWRKGQRCAVPASGWYEWSGPKGGKRRWHFSLGEPDGLFWFGGLHRKSRSQGGDTVRSFTLLTVPANKVVGTYHSTEKDPGGRMPVILDGEDLPRWLEPEADISDLVRTWPDDRTEVWEVPRQAVGFAQALPLASE